MTEVEIERQGYQGLAAKGHMTEEELGAALTELDEMLETVERELEAARARREALKNLQRDRDKVLKLHANMAKEALEALIPEGRHLYKLLRLSVYSRPDQPLEIRSVFANIEGEVGTAVCRPANSRHLAYKGTVAGKVSKRVASGVR
jgi:DNA-directed RNA polymerase subunit F